MQEDSARRTNQERSETTRTALIAAARALFVENGFAGTSTPDIAASAGLTRGALYHHFADKAALFTAVVEAEAMAVSVAIDRRAVDAPTPLLALMQGADAYFDAMAEEGRVRLLLIEGPAVLGLDEMSRIDEASGGESLRVGLEAAMGAAGGEDLPLPALAQQLSAAFDRAALAIARGEEPEAHRRAIRCLLERVVRAA